MLAIQRATMGIYVKAPVLQTDSQSRDHQTAGRSTSLDILPVPGHSVYTAEAEPAPSALVVPGLPPSSPLCPAALFRIENITSTRPMGRLNGPSVQDGGDAELFNSIGGFVVGVMTLNVITPTVVIRWVI